MSKLSYSNDALNVRGAFFGVKAIVYVEGDDDVLFWQEIFSRVTTDSFEVEAVGGAPTLDTYIKKINNGEIEAIAARDADFLSIIGIIPTDPKVLYTYGYSIENSLYVESVVTQLVRSWCKSPRITPNECKIWLDEMAILIKPLVHLDAANAISGSGIMTLGENCSRYATNPNSPKLCASKVAAAVSTIKTQIPSDAQLIAQIKIGNDPSMILTHLRGHFLTSAVHRYIVKKSKEFEKKVSISAESLYAAALAQFISAFDNNHPHKEYYLDSARLAWQAI